MKGILTYGLIGIALIASANTNGNFHGVEQPTVFANEEIGEVSLETKDEIAIEQMMVDRMQQICKVLDVDSTSLTKDQMAELLNKVEEF